VFVSNKEQRQEGIEKSTFAYVPRLKVGAVVLGVGNGEGVAGFGDGAAGWVRGVQGRGGGEVCGPELFLWVTQAFVSETVDPDAGTKQSNPQAR
jgi:hypothetical protein